MPLPSKPKNPRSSTKKPAAVGKQNQTKNNGRHAERTPENNGNRGSQRGNAKAVADAEKIDEILETHA